MCLELLVRLNKLFEDINWEIMMEILPYFLTFVKHNNPFFNKIRESVTKLILWQISCKYFLIRSNRSVCNAQEDNLPPRTIIIDFSAVMKLPGR